MFDKANKNGEAAAAILKLILSLGSGDRSKIRKGDLGSGFWRVWNGAGLKNVTGETAERWQNFIVAVAILVGTSGKDFDAHVTKTRLGETMAQAGVKEIRFEKIILAPMEVRPDLLTRCVRQIAKKQPPLNIQDLCDLFLWEEPFSLRAISASFYSNIQEAS